MFSQVSWIPWKKLLRCRHVLTWTIHCHVPLLVSSFSFSCLLVGYISQCFFPPFLQLGGRKLGNVTWPFTKLCGGEILGASLTQGDSIWNKWQPDVNSHVWWWLVWKRVLILCPLHFLSCLFSLAGLLLPWRNSGAGHCLQSYLAMRVCEELAGVVQCFGTWLPSTCKSGECAPGPWRSLGLFLSTVENKTNSKTKPHRSCLRTVEETDCSSSFPCKHEILFNGSEHSLQ